VRKKRKKKAKKKVSPFYPLIKKKRNKERKEIFSSSSYFLPLLPETYRKTSFAERKAKMNTMKNLLFLFSSHFFKIASLFIKFQNTDAEGFSEVF